MRWATLTGISLLSITALAEEQTTCDTLWNAAELYRNHESKAVQYISLKGRIQGDAVSFHNEDASYETLTWRRFRFGAKAGFLQHFLVHCEMDLDLNELDTLDWSNVYNRLTDAHVGWSPTKAVNFKFGKHSTPFTLDGATSSTKLLVPERSVVAANLWFPTEYFSGIGAYGNTDQWSWRAGGYSASGEPELGHFESGYFLLLSGGRKLGKKGNLRVDYVYNDPDYSANQKYGSDGVGTRDLGHVLSVVYKYQESEKLGFWADATTAKGIEGQSNMLALQLMPFYNFTEQFQLVFQYAGVTSLDQESDVRMGRYPSKIPKTSQVEATHNLLLGFNWFLYGHKLKWQNAVEYNYGRKQAGSGTDYHGYGLTSALRISW